MTPGSYLSQEPENFLLQELRSPSTYNAIITELAKGKLKPTEIADGAHVDKPRVSQCLDRLIELSIVTKTRPVGNKKVNTVRYEIADPLFAFHHRFTEQYLETIDAGLGHSVVQHIMTEQFSTYVGHWFEITCMHWLRRMMASGQIPILFKEIGSWWGTNPKTKTEEEIDIVIADDEGACLAAECKWHNRRVEPGVIMQLRERAALVAGSRQIPLYVFSKSGFSPAAQRLANETGVVLVTARDMFEEQ